MDDQSGEKGTLSSGAGDRNAEFFIGLKVMKGIRLFGDDHGAVVVAHGTSAGHEGIVFGDVRIGVDGDRGDF